jgi:hypothetical protein
MTRTAQETLTQILESGGGVVPDPTGPRMRAPESLIPLVKANRDEIRAVLAMSLGEYAKRGAPLAVFVPWAPLQRVVLSPGVLVVTEVTRGQTWTIGELDDLLTICGHSPTTVWEALVIFASVNAE